MDMTDSLRESLRQLVEQLDLVTHAQHEGSYPIVAAVVLPDDVATLLRAAAAALRTGQITTTTPSRQHTQPRITRQAASTATSAPPASADRPVTRMSAKGILTSHLSTLFPAPDSRQLRVELIRHVQAVRPDTTENAVSVALRDLVRDGRLVRTGTGVYERGPHVQA